MSHGAKASLPANRGAATAIAVALALAVFTMPSTSSRASGGDEPARSPDAGALGDAGSEAAPSALDGSVFPTAPTPIPKADEWTHAERMELTRTGPLAEGCRTYRVREWLRIRCPVKTFALSLLGGDVQGVAFWIGPASEGQPGEVLFPVRRGDRRIVQLWGPEVDAKGIFTPKATLIIQEQWVPGMAAPIVSAM